MTVSETLRRRLVQSGLSLNEVTRQTEIPTSVLSRFANNETGMSQKHIDKLADFLGLRLVARANRE